MYYHEQCSQSIQLTLQEVKKEVSALISASVPLPVPKAGFILLVLASFMLDRLKQEHTVCPRAWCTNVQKVVCRRNAVLSDTSVFIFKVRLCKTMLTNSSHCIQLWIMIKCPFMSQHPLKCCRDIIIRAYEREWMDGTMGEHISGEVQWSCFTIVEKNKTKLLNV